MAVAVTMDSIMKPVFGTPVGTGVADTGAIATPTPIAKDVREFRIALRLVDQDEAARIGQAFDAAHRGDAAEGRQHHRIGERQFVRLGDAAVLADLLDRHLAGFDLGDARIGDPLDVVVAHFAFEQALGVADAVEAEMADIGLRGHEGHRHAVAEFALAQLGVEDEGEFIGRAEA